MKREFKAAGVEPLLARKRAVKARLAAAPVLAARVQELRAWQVSRLARTYADLRASPRYGAAVEFFLSDLYGSARSEQRDREFGRAWRFLKRALPAAALSVLGRAVMLDALSAELDEAMAALLPAGSVANASYAAAYRRLGRRDDRRHQIELLITIGRDLDEIVRRSWITVALRAAHAPAHAAGFGGLQDFLERGAAAFRRMRGAEEFLAAIRSRETELLETLFAGGQPFVHSVSSGRVASR